MNGQQEYKREFIMTQIKRTFNKKYENYCVTRIYHLLQRDDILFITQQMFQRDNGQRGMADLYFPQVNVWVEIDEGHHLAQAEDDEKRTQEIIDKKIKNLETVVSYTQLEEPLRIPITDKSIKEINQSVDKIVEVIKDRVKQQEDNGIFVPWNGVIEDPQYYIKQGFVDTSSSAQFATSWAVSELFNKGYKEGSQKVWFNTCIPNTFVCCIKLALNEGDFAGIRFLNLISDDGQTIYEIDKEDNENFYNKKLNNPLGPEIRYIFAQYKGPDGRNTYKFRGVYKLDFDATKAEKRCVWVKTSNKADLTKFNKK